jgi:hypothetical protein
MNDERKKIMALSKANYRGISLYETLDIRVAFFLGAQLYSAPTLEKATACIDEWLELKQN